MTHPSGGNVLTNPGVQPNINPAVDGRLVMTGQALKNQGDIAPIVEDQLGTLGLVQPVEMGRQDEAAQLADIIRDGFRDEFDRLDPVGSAHAIVEKANDLAGRIQVPASFAFAHTFEGIGGTLHAVGVTLGGGEVVVHPKSPLKPRVMTLVSSDAAGGVLDGSAEAMRAVRLKDIPVYPGDRITVYSEDVQNGLNALGDQGKEERLADAGQVKDNPAQAATLLLGTKQGERDRVVLIEDILPASARRTPQAPAGGATAAAQQNTATSRLRHPVAWWKERRANKQPKAAGKAGKLAMAGAGLATGWAATRRGASWVNTRYLDPSTQSQRKPLNRVSSVGLAPLHYVSRKRGERYDRKMMENRGSVRYADTVTEAERDADFRRRTQRRGAFVVGTLMAVPALTYLFAGDPGEGADVDKGWDALGIPFDTGDAGQGDGSRVDYNWRNLSSTYNDDPTRAHWDKSGALDLAPSWLDGDPMDLEWDGTDEVRTWDPGDTNLPDPREHGGGDTGGNAVNTPAPRGTGPGWDAPRADGGEELPGGGAGGDGGGETVWQSDTHAVTSENLYTSTFEGQVHDIGHSREGFENFDGDDAHNVVRDLRNEFGDQNILNINGEQGLATQANGDVWLASEGELTWRSEEVQRRLYELIEQYANK